MAASCLAYAASTNINAWETTDLNKILDNGDKLYRKITENNPALFDHYLQIREIPGEFESANGDVVHFLVHDSYVQVGILTATDTNDPNFGSLKENLVHT
jgi:hypothetical protein